MALKLKRKPRGDKIYRGAYRYFKGETIYCEEEFEVYKDSKEMGMSFFAALHSRVATGELLNVYIDFQVSKEYIPQKVLIEKTLGKINVKEIYDFDPRTNRIDYLFINAKGQEHIKIASSPKFAISAPSACTSMFCLRTKKEDTTTKNFYQIYSANNNWKFEEEPSIKTIAMERMGTSPENITIEGANVQGLPYKIWDAVDIEDPDSLATAPHLKVHISKFSTVPYKIVSNDGIKIQIKYLNDLN
jgi:hypothetical protein